MQTVQTTEGTAPGQDIPDLRLFVFALFFIFGGITSLNDVLIPKLKELFTLSYAEVMTVQFAFFAAYFIISIPAAAIVKRVGYMRAAVIGLLAMMTGCLLFIPASLSAMFAMFLLALFVLASGITVIRSNGAVVASASPALTQSEARPLVPWKRYSAGYRAVVSTS